MKLYNCYFWLVIIEICVYFKTSIGFSCYFAKDECPNEDVQFWYYKKNSPEIPLLLNPHNITFDIFQPQNPLDILIHGFNLNKDKSPNLEIRPLLLQHANVDVISVDYGSFVRVPCYYPWGFTNLRVVAKCLALLLNTFINQGLYTADMIHLIGFSMGAQVAGLTANHLDFKLSHITGLDPASWGFKSSDPNDKLDVTDADFVDVIHTDPFVFSDINAMGHVDFYPNLASFIQPGCSVFEEARNCNHFRAPVYYAESIITKAGFWSYNCGNYLDFFLKRCYIHNSANQLMGYYVDKTSRGSFFLETNSHKPYAKGELIEAELEVEDNKISNEEFVLCS